VLRNNLFSEDKHVAHALSELCIIGQPAEVSSVHRQRKLVTHMDCLVLCASADVFVVSETEVLEK
jgi:hypothetical protein